LQSLKKIPSLKKILEEIEIPLAPILAEMERCGVLIDGDVLRKQSQHLQKKILKLESQAFELAGQVFNLNSPKQLQEILFGKLGLPMTQKTPTGQASTSEDVLQDLSYEYELPKIILEYRSLSKLKSTYTDRLPEQISGHTGRVHTSYHQAVVPTGRLSSSDPNLQNIPIRTEEGRKIREAFIAPPDSKILSADYSQVELRIMAHLSQDARLLAAFEAEEDIHRATASEVFNVPLDKVSELERRNAKAINFGLMYGMSAFGLAKQLSIPREAAQNYIKQYFLRYPGVKVYMDRTRAQAHDQGYVETLYGRRLYLPDIHARGPRASAAERAAINAPLQGTAADIIKRAMIAMDHWIKQTNLGVRMVMQVHDELVFEVPDQYLEIAKQNITALMAGAADLAVPLVVGIGIGQNWGEAH
jgi:DNA polymerase-1